MITKQQALMTIEMTAMLVMEEFGTDPEKLNTPFAKFVSTIYEMAHTASSPKCRKNHPEWEKRLIQTYNDYVKHELLP